MDIKNGASGARTSPGKKSPSPQVPFDQADAKIYHFAGHYHTRFPQKRRTPRQTDDKKIKIPQDQKNQYRGHRQHRAEPGDTR